VGHRNPIDLAAVGETVSDYVARRMRFAVLLAVCSFAGLVDLRTYMENHPDLVITYPWWPRVSAVLLIALWALAIRGMFNIVRLPCPRCGYWIGIPWIAARRRLEIGRCPHCHVRFDQPVKP
jgi:hypothetical protein